MSDAPCRSVEASPILLQFLRDFSKLGTRMQITGHVNNETREGSYIRMQRGIMTATYFAGYDKQKELYIVERVG